MIRLLTFLLLTAASLCFAEPPKTKNVKFSVPEGYVSLLDLEEHPLKDGLEQMEQGDDGMNVIDCLILFEGDKFQLVSSVIIAKEKIVQVDDVAYLNSIASMFKRDNLGDYQPKEWQQNYIRLDATTQHISYFVKTVNKNQYVYIVNYRDNEFPQEIERLILNASYSLDI
ncbi:hypothetical protein [Pleionea litopenaei]|uniref:DUF1795 domain-containing protein n=1 Tax=Pleionea litopenaei TaxID=3070815 RepID=A0AA51RWA6_9GAMM|nr:hypothetical protein [Pleionea sp. HL-JVS1]WMS88833.1 hypothetical protein Q9312_07915 [Pleionea sp. HL-JVS1]